MVVALFAMSDTLAVAGKNSPPPPPPDGTIFFTRSASATTCGMRTDGTSVTVVLPASVAGLSSYLCPSPSDQVYGTDPLNDRWWIVYEVTGYYDELWSGGSVTYDHPHHDLFAVRTNPSNRSVVEHVQLTDLFGYVLFTRGGSYDALPHWSNNSNEGPDSYVVHPRVTDIRGNFYIDEQGRSIIGPSTTGAPSTLHELRIPLRGSEIQAGWLAGDFVPFGPDSLDPEELELALDLALWPFLLYESGAGTTPIYGFLPGTASPDGSMRVRYTSAQGHFLVDSLAPGKNNAIAYLSNPGTGQGQDRFPQWSPDGNTILIVDGTSNILGTTASGGNLYLQAPFDGPVSPLLLSSSTTKRGTTTALKYFLSKWSSDSQHVVARTYKYTNGTKVSENLVRVSVASGAVVDLKMNTLYKYFPLRWVSNQRY